LWVVLVHQEAQLLGEFEARLPCDHPHFPPPRQGFYPDKEAGRAWHLYS
jgi:hypothetical protein